jgi:hypothetical protein
VGWLRKTKETSAETPNSIRCPRCSLINPASSLWCDCGHVFDIERARDIVAEQSHVHVDRPLGGILFCPFCSRLSPRDTQLCVCGYRFRPPPSDTDTVPAKCPSCHTRLWLQPPIDGAHFTCPKCSRLFSATVSESRQVHVQLIDLLTDLEHCYAILGVPPSATDDDIRRAYQKRIAEYDLTSLPSVSQELRALAQQRQRQFRAAFATLARVTARAS